MANSIRKHLATGIAKEYYNAAEGFEAVGTVFVNANMHYSAAHPQFGLWLCANVMNNQPIIIGFIPWNNIRRIAYSTNSDVIMIVPKDYDSVLANSSYAYRNLYHKTYEHIMSDTGEIAICLPKDLFTGNILPYLQDKFGVQLINEKVKDSPWLVFVQILILILIFGGLIARFFF